MATPADPSKRSAKPKLSKPKATATTAKVATPKVATPKVPKAKATKAATPKSQLPDAPKSRHELIAVTAYYLAEARGFEPGHEDEDWFAAERLIASTRGD